MKRMFLFATFLLVVGWAPTAGAASDTGEAVPRERYANREVLADPTAKDCPETTRSLVQVRDNLYRHTNAEIPYRHSGLIDTLGRCAVAPRPPRQVPSMMASVSPRRARPTPRRSGTPIADCKFRSQMC